MAECKIKKRKFPRIRNKRKTENKNKPHLMLVKKTKTKQNPHQRQICVLSLTDLKDNSDQYPSLFILTLFNKKI